MDFGPRLGTALMLLALLTGCDQASPPTRPTPTPPPAVAPRPVFSGEIVLASISPAPGETVPVRTCAPGTTMICADAPTLSVDVVIDRVDGDLSNAVLSVRFDQCGYWSTPISLIAPGSRLSLTTSVISLSDHEGPGGEPAPPHCEFPAVTARIVVSVWRAGRPSEPPLLTREFAHGYTFVSP